MNLQHLKQSLRIEEVAARYGALHRQGANFRMLCPFHDDHHPSLTIHTGRQFFKCHGEATAMIRQPVPTICR